MRTLLPRFQRRLGKNDACKCSQQFLFYINLTVLHFLDHSFFSARETIVAVEEETNKIEERATLPLPRAAFVPFPQRVGRAAQHVQAHVGHQLEHIRDHTQPHIRNVVKQSQRLAAHVQHELSDLPETRWKELAVALHRGLHQKAVVLRETARPHVMAQRIQHVRHSIVWWMQNMMLESAKLLKQLQQLQLTDMPLQSIRMVRNLCPKHNNNNDEKEHPAVIPFFCNNDDDDDDER